VTFPTGSLRIVIPLATLILLPAAAFAQGGAVDFNRDVRPILSNNCFQCHGPDEKVRKGKLRLDARDDALAAINPGKPDASELLRRVKTSDADEAMPPAKSGKKLTAREVELLTKWVKEGAKYSAHW
jgi:mono/diheme cytochrome c family protein